MKYASQYNVVTSDNGDEFHSFVNEMIAKGWQPYGDLTVTVHVAVTSSKDQAIKPGDVVFQRWQAMVKE